MDVPRPDRTHLLARATGALVLVAGFVYVVMHWSALSAEPTIEGRHLWDQLLGTAEVALAVRLSILGGALYLLASVVGLTIQGRWVAKIGRQTEFDPARTAERQLDAVRSLHRRVRLLEDGEEATAEELAAQSDRLDRLEQTWQDPQEAEPEGEGYDG